MVIETLRDFPTPLQGDDGRIYTARACGRMRDDGLWEGWMEFDGGDIVRRTGRETTQPNHRDIDYWAAGLTDIYLEGALRRALRPSVRPPEIVATRPVFTGPALSATDPIELEPVLEPVLDPFTTYAAHGEDVLRRQLDALAPWHLRTIARAHGIVAGTAEAELMPKAELVESIVSAAQESVAPRAGVPW
jgi:hypothetical protein